MFRPIRLLFSFSKQNSSTSLTTKFEKIRRVDKATISKQATVLLDTLMPKLNPDQQYKQDLLTVLPFPTIPPEHQAHRPLQEDRRRLPILLRPKTLHHQKLQLPHHHPRRTKENTPRPRHSPTHESNPTHYLFPETTRQNDCWHLHRTHQSTGQVLRCPKIRRVFRYCQIK